MSSQVFRTGTEEETIALGEELARGLPPSAVVLLIGELGAGKTTLAKGIVKGLGVAQPEDVSSPSFTLIHEYGAGPKVYHIDLYRLEEAREAATLGIEELLEREAVVLVEWGERFPALWPAERIEIELTVVEGEGREIRVRPRSMVDIRITHTRGPRPPRRNSSGHAAGRGRPRYCGHQ